MTQGYIGVDIGTSSSKAVLADAEGHVLATARRDHEVSMPHPGWFEFDAEVAWAEVVAMVGELAATGVQIDGLTVSAMGPCLVVTGDDLVPLRPTILYGIDTRAGAEITELESEFGTDTILQRSGKSLSSQATGPKLRWIARHEPQVWSRATRWFSLSSWIVARLTGEYVNDHTNASQADPLYDVTAQDWIEEHLRAVTEHLAVPRLVWPTEVVGGLRHDAAEAMGVREGLPICAGAVDAWAEGHSVGVRRSGDVMAMYGTTMFLTQIVDRPLADPMAWSTSGVEPGTRTLAAGMSTSGSVTAWLQHLFGDAPYEDLIAEAEQSPPGARGLLLLPYFAGERSPIFDPDARGVIAGLTLRHNRGDLFRAGYEGIGFGIRQIFGMLAAAGEPVHRVVAVGGGAQSRLWVQIVADVTEQAQLIPEITIGAAYGDALLSAVGAEAVPPQTDWTVERETVRPDPANRERYALMAEAYDSAYPALKQHMHTMAKVQKGCW